MEKNLKDTFLKQLRVEIPFYGLTDEMLFSAEKKLGLVKNYHVLLFPGGIKEVVVAFERELDEEMAHLFREYLKKEAHLKVREKVKLAVKLRLMTVDKPVLSRLKQFYFSIDNMMLGIKNLWRTVDKIWYLVGDSSTDYNYYTKRGLLFGIYKATFLYYISHDSVDATWKFLDRKIENVMKINKVKKFPETLKKLKDKLPFC